MPQHDNIFVIFDSATCVTGRNIGRYLGADFGYQCDRRIDYLIRWGSSTGVRYIPNEDTINYKSKVSQNTNKYRAMQIMDEEGVPVPPFSRDPHDLEYPMLGRSRNHSQGTDINLILQQRDIDLTSNYFYVQYTPTELEYRVHVFQGEVFKVHEKRLRNEADNHPYIRNSGTGWVFLNPRARPPEDWVSIEAVDALGLDFGAVDVIRGEDGTEYVLEVNTGPSCDPANLERYGERLAREVGITDYPGMDHPDIEFEDGDDE